MKNRLVVPVERIRSIIFLIRRQKVILDSDLAELYGVETGALNRAVKRNSDRFPKDFMFQLTAMEVERLRCQIGISKKGRGGRRYSPYAFTEQGVAMLSSVINSQRAIEVNIEIMRTFVQLRRFLSTQAELKRKLVELDEHLQDHDQKIQTIFEAIRQLMSPLPEPPTRKIGFHVQERRAVYTKKKAKKK
jgi:DNA-binding transcriptional MerR regulator